MHGLSSALRRQLLALFAITTVCFSSIPAAQAQAVFKVTAIPDESPTELARKAAPLVKYLENILGV